MKTTDPTIIVEQEFDVSIITLWDAITRVDQMTQWFFKDIPDFRAEVGFNTRFNVRTPNREFMHLWTITEVVPGQKIVYNWNYEGYDGDTFVTFELFEDGSRTRLVLNCEVVEDFDDSIEEFKYESGLAGWNYFIKESLKAYLSA